MRPFRPTSTTPLGTSLRAWGRDRDGAVAVTVAVMTAVLVGVLVLSIDMGRLYNASTERIFAADGAAIAAATQLDGVPGACARAIAAATDTNLENRERFVSNRTGAEVHIDDSNVQLLSELVKDDDGNVTGTYVTTATDCDEVARYAEVTTDLVDVGVDAQVDFYFAGVVGAVTETNPRGYAIAERVSAFCITVPMMMCALDDHPILDGKPFIDALEDFELTGNGLFLKSVNQNDQWGGGNFGFLDLGKGPLGPYIGPIIADPQCLTDGEIFTKTGSTSGARHYFNTRFDIWQGPVVGLMTDENYQPSANGVKGLIRTGGSCAYGGGGSYNDPPTPYTRRGLIWGPAQSSHPSTPSRDASPA